jgi:hypothetical protein
MATSTIRVDSDLLQRIESIKPAYLSTTGFFQLLAEQALQGNATLGQPSRQAPGPSERGGFINKEDKEKAEKLLSESINHPPAQRKQILPELLEFEMLIREFWMVKGGGKSETAWKMLMTGLKAINDLDGAEAVEEQLEAGINGKWKGITLRNYQTFKAKAQVRPWQQEQSAEHPASKVFKASDLDWPEPTHAVLQDLA